MAGKDHEPADDPGEEVDGEVAGPADRVLQVGANSEDAQKVHAEVQPAEVQE